MIIPIFFGNGKFSDDSWIFLMGIGGIGFICSSIMMLIFCGWKAVLGCYLFIFAYYHFINYLYYKFNPKTKKE